MKGPDLPRLYHCCPDKVRLACAAGLQARPSATIHGPDMPDQSLLVRLALLVRVLKHCWHEVQLGRQASGWATCPSRASVSLLQGA